MNLVLFTLTFPYGNGEEFLESEVRVASRFYRSIRLVPSARPGVARPLPANCTVQPDPPAGPRGNPLVLVAGFLRHFLRDLTYDADWARKLRAVRAYWRVYREQHRKYLDLRTMEELTADPETTVLWDFWLVNNGLALVMLGERRPLTVYANAHNYDLYDERWGCPLPFRSTIVRHRRAVFVDSRYGCRYLEARLPLAQRPKVALAYMGVPDHGPGPVPDGPVRTIVSCAGLSSHKRVDRIVRAVADAARRMPNIRWVHFGDGPEMEAIRALARRHLADVPHEFRGWVASADLTAFYRETPVDILVHASEAEGLPVSLMIAASFGVPIVAYDAMGVGELVTPEQGTLLGRGAGDAEFAAAIADMLRHGSRDTERRRRIRERCLRDFSLDNYARVHAAVGGRPT